MVLISIGVIILALIILLLAFPAEIELSAVVDGRVEVEGRLKLVFGLIALEFGGRERRRTEPAREDSVEGAVSAVSNILEAAQVPGIWEQIGRLLKLLFRRVRVRRLDSNLNVSLGDDYYTGMLAGLLLPLALLATQQWGANIEVIPVFEDALILHGFVRGSLAVRPLEVVIPCLAFYNSRPVQQARRIIG